MLNSATRRFVVSFALLLAAGPGIARHLVPVSINAGGTAMGNAQSLSPILAEQGRHVLFFGSASDLVAGDGNGRVDVFRRDLQLARTELVSVAAGGTASGNGDSASAEISADGRWIAFTSRATDLTAIADGNGTADVFLRDADTATTILVSRGVGGAAASGYSEVVGLSADGRRVVFASHATDLVAQADGNAEPDLFVYDRQTGVRSLVSANAAGTATADAGADSDICVSRDGRYVIYMTSATDVVAQADGNQAGDVFRRDLQTGTTALVSVAVSGNAAGNEVSTVVRNCVSDDGRYVLFASEANDLSPLDTDTTQDVYLRDMVAGTTELVSVNVAGTVSANGYSEAGGISGGGRYAAFTSNATDVVGTPTAGTQVFLRDRMLGSTRLISHAPSGAHANNGVNGVQLLRDGTAIVFESRATNLTGIPDANAASDVFLWSGSTDRIELLSVAPGGGSAANGRSSLPTIASNGDIAFASMAIFTVDDPNAAYDVYALPVRVFANGFD